VLILGGTMFLGRALVEAARARGHEITLFNRGRTAPELYPELERLVGDRDGNLSALAGRRWDAVIDTCAYLPRIAAASARLLADQVDHYTIVSSLSVYASTREPGVDESGEVATLADPAVEELTGETYGALKALCEGAVEEALPGRTLAVRPGLIVGPHDPTDRFTYWPWRVARGGRLLAPDRPERRVAFLDVRDLAEWMVRACEERLVGVYNADGPQGTVTMGELVAACRRVAASDAEPVWVSEAFLAEQEVGAWIEMPLWIPASDPDAAGFFAFSCDKAIAAGLTSRAVEETVRATLEWARTRDEAHQWRAGLTAEREAELLAAWVSGGEE
jgi:2'-hydroxyisoflavone reductase